jgi:succinoglycan biosynthesis protein ExoV
MKLFYFAGRDGVTNFGDELNHAVWNHFLPGAFDEDDGTQFVGIGTLLNDRLPGAPRTVVCGAGVGYYGPPQPDGSWRIYCVRGPLSARALNLDASLAITDPAMLVARLPVVEGVPVTRRCAFLPHWESAPDAWRDVCDASQVAFIDPRWPPAQVLDAVRGTALLLTEAMHGAIVADALRVPWVAVRTRPQIKAFKWEDWCQSVGVDYRPHELPPMWPEASAPFDQCSGRPERRRGTAGAIRRLRRWGRIKVVAHALRRLSRSARPSLSGAGVLENRLRRLEDVLTAVRAREIDTQSVPAEHLKAARPQLVG